MTSFWRKNDVIIASPCVTAGMPSWLNMCPLYKESGMIYEPGNYFSESDSRLLACHITI